MTTNSSTQHVSSEKLAHMFLVFPDLFNVISILNRENIHWLIGGSGCLFLLGNERPPEDVDILLPDNQHDTVDKVFKVKSYTYTSPIEEVRNSNPNDNHELQFTSHLILRIDGVEYRFNYGLDFIQDHSIDIKFENTMIHVAPPEEALMVKALLQRGENEGKHDLEDITSFIARNKHINRQYLNQRIHFLNAENRVKTIF